MVNDLYRTPRADHALGGLVNGVIENTIVTSGGSKEIYDIFCEDGSNISLSDRYSLVTNSKIILPSNLLEVGMRVTLIDGTQTGVKKVTKRSGTEIIIPKKMMNLNNYLVIFNG